MGTGILATASATLPLRFPLQDVGATLAWIAAAVLLALLTLGTVLHWILFRSIARSHHRNATMIHFYGAPPMAVLTVSAGTVLVGPSLLGELTAVRIALVLWILGTILGLICATTVPYLVFSRHSYHSDGAFGGWLMPVVPPLVSASAGALIVPHLADSVLRETIFWACYAFFGMSLFASAIIIAMIWSRVTHQRPDESAAVPTVWIVLGPIGQSITAANLLGGGAESATDAALAHTLLQFGIVYGAIATGFMVLWSVIALFLTVRTARRGLPFSLSWWSFTFPIGTCATGMSGMSVHTQQPLFTVLAVIYFTALIAAWCVVAWGTFHGSVLTNRVLTSAPLTRTLGTDAHAPGPVSRST